MLLNPLFWFVTGVFSRDKVSPIIFIAFVRPPVFYIWAIVNEVYKQVEVSYVAPVHRHCPFTHAPFLLQ